MAPLALIRTTTESAGTWWPTTTPSPSSRATCSPTAGAVRANSAYSGCSYFRQHISRPQAPEIFSGFGGRSCTLAIRRLTGSKSFRNVAQHRSRPQLPRPPTSRAASREPICRRSIRACSCGPARSTNARKSTRCGAVK